MSEHKTKNQVDKVAASKKKDSKVTNVKKNDGKKGTVTVTTVKDKNIPVRLITSVVILGLFLLFLVVFIKPEGVIIELVEDLIHGLIGRVGFLVSILGLLYLLFTLSAVIVLLRCAQSV